MKPPSHVSGNPPATESSPPGGPGGAGPKRSFSRIPYEWMVVVLGILNVVGSIGLARFGYPLILPSMKEGLGLTHTAMGLLGSGNFVGYLIASLLGGYWASKYGPKRVILLSSALIGICMIFTGLSQGFLFALVMRFLTGLGSGGAYVPTIGLCMSWFAPQQRGTATGLIVSGNGFGLVFIGWFIPAIIMAHGTEGWRSCWGFLGLCVLVFWVLTLFFLREPPQEKSSLNPSPLSWAKVYKSRPLWHLAFIYFTSGLSLPMFMTFFAAHAIRAGHLPAATIGHIWSLLGFLSIFSGPIWGWVSDRLGRKTGLVIVYAFHGLAYSFFAGARQVGTFYLSAALLGIAAWAIASILSAATADYVGPRLAPAAIGFITVVFGVGQVISPFLAGLIADRTGSFSLAFALAASAAFVGLLSCLRLPSKIV
jgi:MFS family permease